MAVPAPTSIQEVAELVKLLYNPRSTPDNVKQIQETLLKLQASSDGWQIGDTLLYDDDQSVRFFGALTYIVKINDVSSLDETHSKEILGRLMIWLKRLVSRDEGQLVRKKLCSALVALFLRRDTTWIRSIRHLMYSFCWPGDEAVAEPAMDDTWDSLDIASRMTPPQINTALDFATTLATEASKMGPVSLASHTCHQRLRANLPDIEALLQNAMSTSSHEELALSCFASWVKLAQMAWDDTPGALQGLHKLVEPALECVRHDTAAGPAISIFTDMLDDSPGFMEQHFCAISDIFRSQYGRDTLALLARDNDEAVEFLYLLLNYGNMANTELIQNAQDDANREILDLIHDALKVPESDAYGILTPVVEFWTSFCDAVADEVCEAKAAGNSRTEWLLTIRSHLLRACEESWARSRYPPAEKMEDWTDETFQEHNDFRREVADLLRSLSTLEPQSTLSKFTESASTASTHQDWIDLETALWAITILSDGVALGRGNTNEQALKAIMSSPMFSVIAGPDARNTHRLRKTATDFVGHYGKYFAAHPEDLPNVMPFLFDCLESGEATAVVARSISVLCSQCRASLAQSIDDFMEQYRRFLTWASAETDIKEKIIGGIAAIVQATAPTYHGLDRLLTFVEDDMRSAEQFCKANETQTSQDHGLAALRCLVGVSTGLHAPPDTSINLEEETTNIEQDSWTGSLTQKRIYSIIATVVQLIPSGDIIEAACDVFKSGFSESTGPFAFLPGYPVEFIVIMDLHTPRLEGVLSMACDLLEARRKVSHEQAARLLQHVGQLIQALGKSSEDPGVAHNLIDVAIRILRLDEGALIQSIPLDLLNLICEFAIQALRAPDLMPKRAAANFWVRTRHILCLNQSLSPATFPCPALIQPTRSCR